MYFMQKLIKKYIPFFNDSFLGNCSFLGNSFFLVNSSFGLGGMGHFGPQLPQFPFPPTCCPESSINVEHQAPSEASPSQLQSL